MKRYNEQDTNARLNAGLNCPNNHVKVQVINGTEQWFDKMSPKVQAKFIKLYDQATKAGAHHNPSL